MDKFRLCAFADEAGADINEQIKALKENGISLLEVRGVGGQKHLAAHPYTGFGIEKQTGGKRDSRVVNRLPDW